MRMWEGHFVKWIMGIVQHYDHDKYWKRRVQVVNPYSKVPKCIRLWYLFYIKRCDAYNNASMGTDFGSGASFEEPPHLPHHLNGIIVAHDAIIGKRSCIVYMPKSNDNLWWKQRWSKNWQ